jgi:hypothetical protein
MNRYLFLPALTALLLAALAGAQDPPSPAEGVADFGRLERNRALIQELVHSGLSLAGEGDPLKRADTCNGLAKRLAGEIRQAAEHQDIDRATELGDHFCSLLKGGVLPNLSTVRLHMDPGSAGEAELRRVGAETVELTTPLEDLLGRVGTSDPGDLKRLLRSIRTARGEVEKTITPPRP